MFVIGSNGEKIVEQAIPNIAVLTTKSMCRQSSLPDQSWTVADTINLLTVIVCLSDNPKDFLDMLNIFNDCCFKWKLKINTDKTKAMIFGDYARNRPVSFNIAGDEIETINEFKYLGVLFTKNGRFVQHIKYLSALAEKSMQLLRKRTVNLHLPVDCQLKLFDQTIVPILLYGSETFGFENLQPLEKIHLDFLKSILKMNGSTLLIMIYGEFGRFPLEIQVKTRMIKFWAKILTGKNTKISYRMYELLLL